MSYLALTFYYTCLLFRSGNAGLIISNQYSCDWIGCSQPSLKISKITTTYFIEREFLVIEAGGEGHSLYLRIYQNILFWAVKQWTLVLRIGGRWDFTPALFGSIPCCDQRLHPPSATFNVFYCSIKQYRHQVWILNFGFETALEILVMFLSLSPGLVMPCPQNQAKKLAQCSIKIW